MSGFCKALIYAYASCTSTSPPITVRAQCNRRLATFERFVWHSSYKAKCIFLTCIVHEAQLSCCIGALLWHHALHWQHCVFRSLSHPFAQSVWLCCQRNRQHWSTSNFVHKQLLRIKTCCLIDGYMRDSSNRANTKNLSSEQNEIQKGRKVLWAPRIVCRVMRLQRQCEFELIFYLRDNVC